jgi:hypothetical protein
MATSSYIGRKNEDGNVEYIYCHWDGYLDHNGKILFEHYTHENDVLDLLEQGDLSTLEARVNPDKDEDHSWENPAVGVCVFYMRDRGEKKKNLEAKITDDFESLAGEVDFVYLFQDGAWFYQRKNSGLIPLSSVFSNPRNAEV